MREIHYYLMDKFPEADEKTIIEVGYHIETLIKAAADNRDEVWMRIIHKVFS